MSRPVKEYMTGDKIGECTFLEERQPVILNESSLNKIKFVKRIMLFRCSCGKEFQSSLLSVKSLRTKSCGCLQRVKAQQTGLSNKKHGLRSHPLYPIWKSMIYRCENSNNKYYYNYGGRGISVCNEWKVIDNFIKDMYSSYFKGLELDRVNNDGDYCKENCRWATSKQNSNNKRNNRVVEFNGTKKTISEWSDYTGLSHQCILERLKTWNLEEVFTTPICKNQYSRNYEQVAR